MGFAARLRERRRLKVRIEPVRIGHWLSAATLVHADGGFVLVAENNPAFIPVLSLVRRHKRS